MRNNPLADIKINKKAISVVSLSDAGDDKAYWSLKTPVERLKQIEILRWINYGDAASGRLQRVLEVAERS